MSRVIGHKALLSLSVLVIGIMATSGAWSQYADNLAKQCAATSGAVQVDNCMASLRSQPGNAELLLYLGDGLLISGRAGEALNAYRQALSINPSLAAAHIGRSRMRQIYGPAPYMLAAVWSGIECMVEWNFADLDQDGVVSNYEAGIYFEGQPATGYDRILRGSFLESCQNGTLAPPAKDDRADALDGAAHLFS